MAPASDTPSPIQRAAFWTGRITNAGIQMVVPVLLGHWLDQRLQTSVLFTLVGCGLGMVLAIYSLVQLTKKLAAATPGSLGPSRPGAPPERDTDH